MFDISDEKYEELRAILGKQYVQAFTLEEAKEIGDGLVDFYRLLLENRNEENINEENINRTID